MSEKINHAVVDLIAYFGFDDFNCAPEVITQSLGLEPDTSAYAGESYQMEGMNFIYPRSFWKLMSRSDSKDINDHLRQLLQRIKGCEHNFENQFGQANFNVHWKGYLLHQGSGPSYDADVLQGIAALNAKLNQTIYQVDRVHDE